MKIFFLILLTVLTFEVLASKNAPWQVGEDFKGLSCQNRSSADFGPFDYTNAEAKRKHLKIVEDYHYSKAVQMLKFYKARSPVANLNYVLSVWPNHHKALRSVVNYSLLYEAGIKRIPLTTPPECFFQRAINFSRKDAVTHLLYARYLTKKKKYDTAEKLYQRAILIAPENPAVHYNYGVLLLKMNKIKEARTQAEKAKLLGHPHNTLLLKLERK